MTSVAGQGTPGTGVSGEVPGEQRVPHNPSWTLLYLNSIQILCHTPQPSSLPFPCTPEHKTKPLPFPPSGAASNTRSTHSRDLCAHPTVPFLAASSVPESSWPGEVLSPPCPSLPSHGALGSCHQLHLSSWETFPARRQRGWQPPPDLLHGKGMSGTS